MSIEEEPRRLSLMEQASLFINEGTPTSYQANQPKDEPIDFGGNTPMDPEDLL